MPFFFCLSLIDFVLIYLSNFMKPLLMTRGWFQPVNVRQGSPNFCWELLCWDFPWSQAWKTGGSCLRQPSASEYAVSPGITGETRFLTGWPHDDVVKWKQLPRYWPFVRRIHRAPVNSPHKGQWRGALMFSLICAWINCWVNNHEIGDVRRHRAHHDVTVLPGQSKI